MVLPLLSTVLFFLVKISFFEIKGFSNFVIHKSLTLHCDGNVAIAIDNLVVKAFNHKKGYLYFGYKQNLFSKDNLKRIHM